VSRGWTPRIIARGRKEFRLQKLEIWRPLGAAYRFVFARPGWFLPSAWPGLILLISLEAGFAYADAILPPPSPTDHLMLVLGAVLVALCAAVSAAVAIQRSIFLGETSWGAGLRFGRLQLRYLGAALLIVAILVVPFIIFVELLGPLAVGLARAGVSTRATLASEAASAYVLLALLWLPVGKLLLALPAVALDEGEVISGAWERSRGNAWRLFLAGLACLVPLTVVQAAADYALRAYAASARLVTLDSGATIFLREYAIFASGLDAVIAVLEFALLMAFYAFAYRQFAEG